MTNMIKTYSIIIKGQVQGVGFRWAAKKTADKNNIKGFVKNLPDRSVYIIATGTEIDLNNFLNWCYKGPVHANVSEVIYEIIPIQEFNEFSIKS